MGSKVLRWVHFAGETSEAEVVEFERPINLASPSLDVFWFCDRMTFPSALIKGRGGGSTFKQAFSVTYLSGSGDLGPVVNYFSIYSLSNIISNRLFISIHVVDRTR